MQNFLIGCDPELFCFDPEKGQYVSAHEWMPGTKKDPYLVTDGALQLDGTAVELNVDPTDDVDVFVNRIFNVVQSAYTFLPDGIELRAKPTIHYSQPYYTSLPRATRRIGCERDRDAWDKGILNTSPTLHVIGQCQGGGHIHIGWTEDRDRNDKLHRAICIDLVKQLDYYVGLSTLCWDDDHTRRRGYGKPGAFRIKPYGLEYRTPSNKWAGDPKLARTAFELTMIAAERFRDGERLFDEHGNQAKRIIESNNVAQAQEILNAIL